MYPLSSIVILTGFGGGEWFALDLVHQTVFGLVESAITSQQPSKYPRKMLAFRS